MEYHSIYRVIPVNGLQLYKPFFLDMLGSVISAIGSGIMAVADNCFLIILIVLSKTHFDYVLLDTNSSIPFGCLIVSLFQFKALRRAAVGWITSHYNTFHSHCFKVSQLRLGDE